MPKISIDHFLRFHINLRNRSSGTSRYIKLYIILPRPRYTLRTNLYRRIHTFGFSVCLTNDWNVSSFITVLFQRHRYPNSFIILEQQQQQQQINDVPKYAHSVLRKFSSRELLVECERQRVIAATMIMHICAMPGASSRWTFRNIWIKYFSKFIQFGVYTKYRWEVKRK